MVYNNPQGFSIDLEPNAIRFVKIIQTIANEVIPGRVPNIIDLHLGQQHNGVDCGPFTVDNLVRIARNAATLDSLDRDGIIARVGLFQPADGNAAIIRAEHNAIFTDFNLQTPTETNKNGGLIGHDMMDAILSMVFLKVSK